MRLGKILALALAYIGAMVSVPTAVSQEPSEFGKSLIGENYEPVHVVEPNIEQTNTSEVYSLPPEQTTNQDDWSTTLQLIKPEEQDAVQRFRKGFFQRWEVSGGWLSKSGDTSLGQSFLQTSASVAVPLGSFKNLLIITPGFQVDFLDGPTTVDVPAQLYATGVDFMWRGRFSERWGGMVGVKPSVISDFRATDNAFRVTGRALLTWECLPEHLTLIFGVVVLNRSDIPALPGVGLIWTPKPNIRADLVFPRPKVAYRIGYQPSSFEHWVYLSGKLGGRTWAVRRDNGSDDELTLRDYRLAIGFERIQEGGSGMFVEIGYVFGRTFEYESMDGDLSFSDAVLLEGGIRF